MTIESNKTGLNYRPEKFITSVTIGALLLLGATACGEAKHAFNENEDLCMPKESGANTTAEPEAPCYYGEVNP